MEVQNFNKKYYLKKLFKETEKIFLTDIKLETKEKLKTSSSQESSAKRTLNKS